ncbi:MAG: alpha/beta hydrolase [Planctomycetota bacterium]
MESTAAPIAPKKRLGNLWRLIRTLMISYAVVLIALVWMESRLLFPGAYQRPESLTAMPPVEPFEFTSGGQSVTGFVMERPLCDHTILFFHGNAVHSVQLQPWLMRLSESCNATVVAAEYRGFQDPDVTPTEDNLIQDGLAVHAEVCRRYDLTPDQLTLYGRSLGGGCAVAVAQAVGARKLVLDRTFDSAVGVAASRYFMFPIHMVMSNSFDSAGRIQAYDGPLLQVHGTPDEVIPIGHARKLFSIAPSPKKTFLELPGLLHNDPFDDSQLVQVANWIKK